MPAGVCCLLLRMLLRIRPLPSRLCAGDCGPPNGCLLTPFMPRNWRGGANGDIMVACGDRDAMERRIADAGGVCAMLCLMDACGRSTLASSVFQLCMWLAFGVYGASPVMMAFSLARGDVATRAFLHVHV